jgi:hypothetical protein
MPPTSPMKSETMQSAVSVLLFMTKCPFTTNSSLQHPSSLVGIIFQSFNTVLSRARRTFSCFPTINSYLSIVTNYQVSQAQCQIKVRLEPENSSHPTLIPSPSLKTLTAVKQGSFTTIACCQRPAPDVAQ